MTRIPFIESKLSIVKEVTCVKCKQKVDTSNAKPFSVMSCACGARLKVPAMLDQFQINKVLGQGAMSVVYEAVDLTLRRRVALKVLKADSDEARSIMDEARMLASLNHQNVVRVYSVGRSKDQPYIVMELLKAGSLDKVAPPDQPLDEATTLQLMIDVAGGLKATSHAGILHGDVKPSNILIDEHQVAKVIDFGIANSDMRSEKPAALGTPYYVAPEIIKRQKPDHRADIYSLGATLYRTLTGKPPFTGSTIKELLTARLSGPAPDVRDDKPAIFPETANIVAKMLQIDPDNRHQDYDELIDDLYTALEKVTSSRPQSEALGQLNAALRAAMTGPGGAGSSIGSGSYRMATGSIAMREKPGVPKWVYMAVGGGAAALLLLIVLIAAFSGGSTRQGGGTTGGPVASGRSDGDSSGSGSGRTSGSGSGSSSGTGIVTPPPPPPPPPPPEVEWQVLNPQKMESTGGVQLKKQTDKSILASGPNPTKVTYTITAKAPIQKIGAIAVEFLHDKSLPAAGPGRSGTGSPLISELTVKVAPVNKPNETKVLKLKNPKARYTDSVLKIENLIDADSTTDWSFGRSLGEANIAVFETEEPIDLGGPVLLTFILDHQSAAGPTSGRFRFGVAKSLPIRLPSLPRRPEETDVSDWAQIQLPGMHYEYFEARMHSSADFEKHKPAREGMTVRASLELTDREHNVGLRFTGTFTAPRDGEYTFAIRSDDGSSLWIGDNYLINNDGDKVSTEKTGKIQLTAGDYPIKVTYYNGGGDRDFGAVYEGPGLPRQAMPGSAITLLQKEMGPSRAGLSAWWQLDDFKSPIASDSTGRGYGGKVINGKWTGGRLGMALEFDGTGHVLIDRSQRLKLSQTDFSLSAWVRTADDGVILSKSSAEGKWGPQAKALILRDGKLALIIEKVGEVIGKTHITDDRWHHVAINYQHRITTFSLYVDGKLDGKKILKADTEPKDYMIRLGAAAEGLAKPGPLKGAIDDVRIYRSPLKTKDLTVLATGQTASGASDTAVVSGAADKVLIARPATWRYLDQEAPPKDWKSNTFDDSGWANGEGSFGYAIGDVKIKGKGSRAAAYFRHSFEIKKGEIRFPKLVIHARVDDGAVFYLNGKELKRTNMPVGPVKDLTLAAGRVFSPQWQKLSADGFAIKQGKNVLAVEVHQNNKNSADAAFDLQLTGTYKPQNVSAGPAGVDADWHTMELASIRSKNGANIETLPDGSFLVSGSQPSKDIYTVKFNTDLANITALKLEVLPHPSLPNQGPGRHPSGSFVLSRFSVINEPIKAAAKIKGRFVRIENLGSEKSLSLAEVQVFSGGENIARTGKASQSSTGHNGPASLAIDGITNGDNRRKSVNSGSKSSDKSKAVANKLPAGFKPLFARGDSWQYLAGSDPKGDWTAVSFKAAGWKTGKAGFGYGDDDDKTQLSMRGKYSRVYIRKTFSGKDALAGSALGLMVNYDDAFIAYLNGKEIIRIGILKGSGAKASGVSSHEASSFGYFPIDNFKKLLKPGVNVISLEGHNTIMTSSDFSLDPYLVIRGGKAVVAQKKPPTKVVDVNEQTNNTWWEVDLATLQQIDRIVVWNRTDGNLQSRLNGCRVLVLDDKRKTVFTRAFPNFKDDSKEIVFGIPASLKMKDPVATLSEPGFEVDNAVVMRHPTKAGWGIGENVGSAQHAIFPLQSPIGTAAGSKLTVKLTHNFDKPGMTLGRFRITATTLTTPPGYVAPKWADVNPNSPQIQTKLIPANQPMTDTGKWYVMDIHETRTNGKATMLKVADGSILVRGSAPIKNEIYTIKAKTDLRGITGIRLDCLSDPAMTQKGPGRNGNFAISYFEVKAGSADGTVKPKKVNLVGLTSSFNQGGHNPQKLVNEGDRTGWAIHPKMGENHFVTLKFKEPIDFEGGAELHITMRHLDAWAVGRFTLSLTTNADPKTLVASPTIDRPSMAAIAYVPLAIQSATSSVGATIKATEDNVATVTGKMNINDTYTVVANTKLENITGVRLEVLTDPTHARKAVGRITAGYFRIIDFKLSAAPLADPTKTQPVTLSSPRADFEAKTNPVSALTDGDARSTWSGGPKRVGEPMIAAMSIAKPIGYPGGTVLTFEIKQAQPIARFRLSVTTNIDPTRLSLTGQGTAPVAGVDKGTVKKPDPKITPPSKKDYYLNMGAEAATAKDGKIEFEKCPRYVEGKYGVEEGGARDVDDVDKKQSPIYGRVHMDPKAVRAAVANGKYRVTLVFVEPERGKRVNQRIFSVWIEGRQVIRDLDILDRTNKKHGVPWPYSVDVVVKDGRLDIEFEKNKSGTTIAAVAIKQLVAARKRP